MIWLVIGLLFGLVAGVVIGAVWADRRIVRQIERDSSMRRIAGSWDIR